MESYGANSLQYTQAKDELVGRCDNRKIDVAAFARELENVARLHVIEPQNFVRFAAFLRELAHNFDLNNYISHLNSSFLTRLDRSKLPPAGLFSKEEYCVPNEMDYATVKYLTDCPNINSRACKNLDVLPDFGT